MNNSKVWDRRLLNLAKEISTWSKDPSTQVGAVIVNQDRTPVSFGYNGFAKGVEDTEGRLNNRDLKYKLTIHAEKNAVLFSNQSLSGCILYTYPFIPCTQCASMIIQCGISRVVSLQNNNSRWAEDFSLSRNILREAGIDLIEYEKSLIFK